MSLTRSFQTFAQKHALKTRGAAIAAASLFGASFSAAAPSPQAAALPAVAPAAAVAAPAVVASRTLSFHNLHTEEKLTVTYWRDGAYDYQALGQVARLLRDHRRDESFEMNTGLLDTLHTMQQQLKEKHPDNPMVFEVISGYRARATTDALRRRGAAVASDTSQHQLGNALDFRIRDIPLVELRDTAWCLQQGGVGFYPESHNNFIHVDTGRVRFWPASRTAWRCMS